MLKNATPRLLFLTRYGYRSATSRYRFFQYIPALTARGFQCDVAPLLDDKYLEGLNSGRRRHRSVLSAMVKRFRLIAHIRQFDLVILEKELFPFLPFFAERSLRTPYIVDYDDATFHRYDYHRNLIVRAVLRRKIASVMRRAATVVAGNEYLADYARRAGARQIHVLPTVVDLRRYSCSPHRGSAPLTVGWIGSPTTTFYVQSLVPALQPLLQNGTIRLRIIGGTPWHNPPAGIEFRAWSEDTEVHDLCTCDVGIMPLEDDPWSRGKCGFKLIQSMACGLPVIASPIGVNRDIVEHGINGFLATTDAQWREALTQLHDDEALRQRMGSAALQKIEAQYSLEVTSRRYVDIIEQTLAQQVRQ